MASFEDFNDIVGNIYDAAADSAGWTDVVQQVASACGGFGGCLMMWDFEKKVAPIVHQVGYDDRVTEEYGNYYCKLDPGAVVLHQNTNLVVFNDPVLGTTQELKRKHEFYDWLEGASDQRHGFGARLFTGKQYESILLMARSGRQDEAGEYDLKKVGFFVSHLRRSISLARKIGENASMAAFDVMPFGIVILDDLGQVSFSNKAMSAIAADRDGIELTRHGLRLALPAEDAAYHKLVGRTRTGIFLEPAMNPTALSASRPSGKRPYSIMVAPCPRRNGVIPEFDRSVMLCVSDPTYVGHLTTDVLSALFGLSLAEARLARALVEFGALSAAADYCGLTQGSARQYMKRIYTKTGTSGQVELLSLILGSVRL